MNTNIFSSESAAAPKIVVMPRSAVVTTQMKAILPELWCSTLTSRPLYTLLSKSGIRDYRAVLSMSQSYVKSASDKELLVLLPKVFEAKLRAKFEEKIILHVKPQFKSQTASVVVLTGRAKVVTHSMFLLYAQLSLKVCAALGIDYAKSGNAVTGYLLYGTAIGGNVPLKVKALWPKPSSKVDTPSVKDELADDGSFNGKTLTDLTVKDFKGADGQAYVDALPALYKEYIKANTKKASKTIQVTTARRTGKRLTFGLRPKKVTSKKPPKDSLLSDAVGEELFSFYQRLIPALRTKQRKAVSDLKAVTYLQRRAKRMDTGKLKVLSDRYKATTAPAAKAALKVRLDKLRAATSEKLADKKAKVDEARELHDSTIKSWMIPYLDSSVNIKAVSGRKVKIILGDGILTHRLVEKANAGKLKAGDVELSAVLDVSNASLLTYKGVARIVSACEDSSTKAFKTIFKNVVEVMRLKVFTIGITDITSNTLVTPTGKVTNARLLRLNSITPADETAVVVQYEKELKAWNPLKTDIAVLAKSLSVTKKDAVHQFAVVKSSSAELAANRLMVPSFMTNTHNVDIRVASSWEVKPTKSMDTILKNQGAASKIQVIRNVFHGTSRQAGSVILSCGFKIRGTMVTARSMGDVLYIAPNIDKSAQYFKTGGGFTRNGTGLIFMGDILINGKAGSTGTFGWTHTGRYATEEIGLRNPNSQFIIRKVLLISTTSKGRSTVRQRAPSSKRAIGSAHFSTPVAVSSYNLPAATTKVVRKRKTSP